MESRFISPWAGEDQVGLLGRCARLDQDLLVEREATAVA
jgi:hypothetical protein